MGNFTSGFQELANKLVKAQQKVPIAIDNALIDTGYSVVGHAKDNSPIDATVVGIIDVVEVEKGLT
jgi:microcompartment protein CcmK/EutM